MARQDTYDDDLMRLYVAHRRGFERLYEELVVAHRHAARLRADLEMGGIVQRRHVAPRGAASRPHTRPL